MKNFLVLYRSESAPNGMSVSEMLANTTPEQMEKGMGAWRVWFERCSGAITDLGAPLDHSTSVAGEGSATPAKTTITGYSVLKAESMEAAVALMKGHPHFYAPSASVQILEAVPMPGM